MISIRSLHVPRWNIAEEKNHKTRFKCEWKRQRQCFRRFPQRFLLRLRENIQVRLPIDFFGFHIIPMLILTTSSVVVYNQTCSDLKETEKKKRKFVQTQQKRIKKSRIWKWLQKLGKIFLEFYKRIKRNTLQENTLEMVIRSKVSC